MEAERNNSKKRIKRDWVVVFKAYGQSGLTVKDFCQVQGISVSLFYRRRKELKDSALPEKSSLRSNDFIRLSSTVSPDPPVSIVFGGQIEVFIHNDCDRVLLGDIIAQLKESSC
jgi:hypothetical protein